MYCFVLRKHLQFHLLVSFCLLFSVWNLCLYIFRVPLLYLALTLSASVCVSLLFPFHFFSWLFSNRACFLRILFPFSTLFLPSIPMCAWQKPFLQWIRIFACQRKQTVGSAFLLLLQLQPCVDRVSVAFFSLLRYRRVKACVCRFFRLSFPFFHTAFHYSAA